MTNSSLSLRRNLDPITGFTLIELLVVIAIIAVLAGLAMPVFSSVRQTGYQAKSISNLRQLSVAATAYSSEHDGWFPSDYQHNADGTFNYGNYWRLDPEFTKYLADLNPTWAVKPSSVVRSGYPASPDPTSPNAGTLGYNDTDVLSGVATTPSWLANTRALRNSSITYPTRLILFAESVASVIQMGSRDQWTPNMDQGGGGNKYGVIAYRANGNTKSIAVTYGGNILMIDRPKVGATATRADYELWRNYWPSNVPAN